MDKPENFAKQGTLDEEKQNKTQHNTCWTPLYSENNMKPIIYFPNYLLFY